MVSGGERWQVEGSYCSNRRGRGWRGAIAGGEERSPVERSDRRLMGAIAGGEELSQDEKSDCRWKGLGAIDSGGKRSQVE